MVVRKTVINVLNCVWIKTITSEKCGIICVETWKNCLKPKAVYIAVLVFDYGNIRKTLLNVVVFVLYTNYN